MIAPDIHVVSYGIGADLAPLQASVARQTLRPSALRIWHNGPRFPLAHAGASEILGSGENLGFGAGHNRLFQDTGAPIVIVANPDLDLDPRCVERLVTAITDDAEAVLVGALLTQTKEQAVRVNALGLGLTWDFLGVNPDRGRVVRGDGFTGMHGENYLGPSGALFAVHVSRFRRLMGRQLFPESLFLYGEDVALGLKARSVAAVIRLCPAARAEHQWSATAGQRSGLKLFHVERNRLWTMRAILGEARAAARMPFTALRYAAYAAAAQNVVSAGASLGGPLARGLRDGALGSIPTELRTYLGDPTRLRNVAARYRLPLAEQLHDPTADAKSEGPNG